MKLTYKYRIYPSHSRQTALENIFSMCRHLYNWNLQERMEVYEKEKRSVTYQDQQNALPKLKKDRPWFKGVYSQVLQDVLKRLDKAYKRFFKQKIGFPKYKKKGQWFSITYPQFEKRPSENTIDIPKLGKIKLVYHREIPKDAVIKTMTIRKDGGKWFACFSVDLPGRLESKPVLSRAAGIDLGLNSFLFTSGNDSISAPKYLRKSHKRIKCLQRKLSKAKRRTPYYMKVLKALQKSYYRLRCKRQAFFYETSYLLFEKNDIVCVEDLNIANMVRRPEAKQEEETGKFLPNGASQKSRMNSSIYDAGWGTFVEVLKNVSKKLGKIVIEVPARYTSQKCSCCGEFVEKSLSTRTHSCPGCGYTADRDYNAARNILRLGLESLESFLEAPTIMQSI